jgi:hypothetical protein
VRHCLWWESPRTSPVAWACSSSQSETFEMAARDKSELEPMAARPRNGTGCGLGIGTGARTPETIGTRSSRSYSHS